MLSPMSERRTTHFGYEEIPEDEKAGRVHSVFSSVAARYDLMNDLMSGGLHRLWKRFTVELSGANITVVEDHLIGVNVPADTFCEGPLDIEVTTDYGTVNFDQWPQVCRVLLMMLAVINGIDATVAVTSRNAYSFLSAGAIFAVAPVITQPTRSVISWISRTDRSVRNPGIDSSLSSVPPVGPRPRPEIIGTRKPQQASSGAKISETVSPLPPVECLSTTGFPVGHDSLVPLRNMASVKAAVSSGCIPRK